MPTSEPDPCLRIIQLTDCHLYASSDGSLLGLNTFDSLSEIIQLVTEYPNPANLIIVTGDLVHDGSKAGYQKLADLLSRTECNCFVLPGNHDHIANLNLVMSKNGIQSCGHHDAKNWRLIMLNSQIPGEPGGHLCDAEINRLKRLLDDDKHYKLIFLHHHPAPVGSKWLDEIGLDNGPEFLQLIENAPHVKGVIFGHVHQQWEDRHHHIKLFATPSTCIQFAPNMEDFSLSMSQPGWRTLSLYDNGKLTSEVHQLADIPRGVIANSAGYK